MPPRQLAVLILRDVLGFHADEVAEMLDTTVESVNSALKRARAGLDGQQQSAASPPGARAVPEQAMVAKFVSAYETADIDFAGRVADGRCVHIRAPDTPRILGS